MDLHFTYSEENLDQLRQGDILRKTPDLLSLIKEIHPHYAGEEYLYFQVLTQSCDLVRRNGGQCKSRYITIAAVRSLEAVIGRAIEKFSSQLLFKDSVLCSEKHKGDLTDVFNKLLNNNDPHHFFLNAAPQFGFMQDCCTVLHLSISIRAYQHYDVCLAAKIFSLTENFRAKLGWVVGNLYSRVGTEDYVPGAMPDEATYKAFVKAKMDEYVVWIQTKDFGGFKTQSANAASVDEILKRINEERLQKQEDQIDQLVTAVMSGIGIDPEKKKTLKNLLSQHPLIQSAVNR